MASTSFQVTRKVLDKIKLKGKGVLKSKVPLLGTKLGEVVDLEVWENEVMVDEVEIRITGIKPLPGVRGILKSDVSVEIVNYSKLSKKL